MNKKIIASLVMLMFLSGCASIVGKSTFPLTINSQPDDATILIKDERGKQLYKGQTPTTLSLSAGESYFHAKRYYITFSKPGYEEQTTEVKSELSGWYFGNILFGGLIGLLIVDPITGKMWKLPTDTTITLQKQQLSQAEQRSLRVVNLDTIPKDIQKKLISLN